MENHMSDKPAVLFVCLGNICRSPLAEAAFRVEVAKAGLDAEIDSAGTGSWHIGSPPDKRAQNTAHRHGVDITSYRGRQVSAGDFRRFTHVIALDKQNLADLKKMRPADSKAELRLLMDYVPGREGQAVADPYYGDEEDFEVTWNDVTEGARALVRVIAGRG
jgi:Protein-tyrosine-phosphatase